MQPAPRPRAVPLNLRQIEVFHAIMIAGTLSEAGRALCVSQPAVSRMLATAESRLGFLLFERTKGRLQPTPEARSLFSEVEAIHECVNRFNALALSLAEGTEGKLRLVSSPSYSEWLMPRAIGRFRTRHPDIQISYRPLPFDSLIPHVLLGHADLGITTMPPVGSSNLVAREIGQGAIVCAIPRTHPLAREDRITADHLSGHTFIGYGKDTPFGHLTSPFLTSGSTQGEITPDIEIRSTPEAMAMVRQGVGVALVESHGYAQSGLEDVVLRPIHPALPHKIYLIHTRDNPLSKLAQGFLTNLKHVLQKDGPGEPGIK